MPGAAVHGDEELIERARAGDRAAYRSLVERHGPALFRYARTLTAQREDAEDVLQEALLAAFRSLEGFRGEASPKTWLFTIVRHAAYRLNRRRAQAPEPVSDLEALGRAAGWGGSSPETLAALAEDRRRLEAALGSLAGRPRDSAPARSRGNERRANQPRVGADHGGDEEPSSPRQAQTGGGAAKREAIMKPEPRHVGGLDCFEVLARLSDYLDGELDPVEKAQVEEHVRGCDWCERFGGEMGGLVHELRRQMAEPEPLEGGFLDRLGI